MSKMKFNPDTEKRMKKIEDTFINLDAGNELVTIRIEDIRSNEFNKIIKDAETKIKDEELEYLINSIKENGVMTPIAVVRQGDSKFRLIAGEKRVIASKKLGLESIPAKIISIKANTEEGESLKEELALIDDNMSARTYDDDKLAKIIIRTIDIRKKLVELGEIEDNLNVIEHLSKKLDISKSKAKKLARIANLDKEIQEKIMDGTLSVAAGSEIGRLSENKQEEFYDENKDELEGATAKKVKELVDEKKGLGKKESREDYIDDLNEEKRENSSSIVDNVANDTEKENIMGVKLAKYLSDIELTEIEKNLIKSLDSKLNSFEKRTLIDIFEKHKD